GHEGRSAVVAERNGNGVDPDRDAAARAALSVGHKHVSIFEQVFNLSSAGSQWAVAYGSGRGGSMVVQRAPGGRWRTQEHDCGAAVAEHEWRYQRGVSPLRAGR